MARLKTPRNNLLTFHSRRLRRLLKSHLRPLLGGFPWTTVEYRSDYAYSGPGGGSLPYTGATSATPPRQVPFITSMMSPRTFGDRR
jgi:hypothetical protein